MLSMSDGSSRAWNLLRNQYHFMNRNIFIISQLNGVGSTVLIHPCHNTLYMIPNIINNVVGQRLKSSR